VRVGEEGGQNLTETGMTRNVRSAADGLVEPNVGVDGLNGSVTAKNP